MNLYQEMWDRRGFGRRWNRVMRTGADIERKRSALCRIWHRMASIYG